MGTACEEWPGTRFQSGYGRDGQRRAHRVAWERAHGPIPAGLMVLHKCDNRPCVNVDHLYLGTHADNMRDRKVRERDARGQRVNTNKLTPEQVQQVRWLCDSGEYRHRHIARAYGITQPMVSFIGRRTSWAWLPDEPAEPPQDIKEMAA